MSRPTSRPAASEPADASRRPIRILIADDEPDAVLTLSTILRLEGYEVNGVHDGSAVLPAAEEFKPDVAILDINMPGMNGFDVAKNLRMRYGEDGILLIAITGVWNKGSDKILSRLNGFNQHLGKPVEPRALMDILANVTPQDGRRGRL
jgi:DNA-binding response OmpR family regulator